MGMQVIKKELSETEIAPNTIRYDGTPPVFQQTNDGGTTWVDNPAGDPRYNPVNLLPPLTTYTGIECDVAARMTAQLKDTLTIFINSVDAAQFASGVLALLAFEVGWIGWLLDLLLLVANALIDIGQADIEAAFTDSVYDDIQCTFSCFVGDDGQISQSSLDAAYDQIESDHPGTVANVIEELRLFYGDVSMSNAGVARTETGDCSGCPSCDWVIEYDFTTGNMQGWQFYFDATYLYGQWNGASMVAFNYPGAGKLIYAVLNQAGIHVTGWSYFGSSFHGSGIGNFLRTEDMTSTGQSATFTQKASSALPTVVADSWQVAALITFTTTAGFGFWANCDGNGSGSIILKKIRLQGTGTPPTGGVRVNSLT